MFAVPVYHGLLVRRRRSRAFFLAWTTQHLRSLAVLREVARGLAALAGLAAWGTLALLVAG